MTTGDPTVALIQAAAQRESGAFAAKMADSSLEAAVDVWLQRMARRKVTPVQRMRLVKAVERASAAETKDVQLTRAALLRTAGLDERPAAAAAIAAGATYTEVGAVLGMTQQGASARIRPYLAGRGQASGMSAMTPAQRPVDRHVLIVSTAGSFTAAGERVTGPVTSVDKLERLIEWAHQRGCCSRLQPPAGDDTPRRRACGWWVRHAGNWLAPAAAADAEVTEQIGRALGPLVGRGWELKGGLDRRFILARGRGAQRISVEVVVEPQPWLGGAGPVADDRRSSAVGCAGGRRRGHAAGHQRCGLRCGRGRPDHAHPSGASPRRRGVHTGMPAAGRVARAADPTGMGGSRGRWKISSTRPTNWCGWSSGARGWRRREC